MYWNRVQWCLNSHESLCVQCNQNKMRYFSMSSTHFFVCTLVMETVRFLIPIRIFQFLCIILFFFCFCFAISLLTTFFGGCIFLHSFFGLASFNHVFIAKSSTFFGLVAQKFSHSDRRRVCNVCFSRFKSKISENLTNFIGNYYIICNFCCCWKPCCK